LDAQYELGRDWVATLGYQGSETRHLTVQDNLYRYLATQGIAFNLSVPHLQLYSNTGTANFNALLGEVKHQFSRSFMVDTQYRWSKSLDDGSNNFSNSDYPYVPGASHGPSDYDTRHAFKVFGVWSPTIFHGSNSWMEKVAGGWTVSGIFNTHTGFPWTPFAPSGCDAIYQGSSNGGGTCNLRPAQYLGGAGSDQGTDVFKKPLGNFPNGALAYFVPATVTPGPTFDDIVTNGFPTGPVPSAPGIGRNSFRGPRYFDIDMTLSKAFGLPKMKILGEGAKLEIKANFFNLFNKLNLYNVQGDITNPNFGTAQNALGGRTVEMQARFSF
jgi:hypothetical protein